MCGADQCRTSFSDPPVREYRAAGYLMGSFVISGNQSLLGVLTIRTCTVGNVVIITASSSSFKNQIKHRLAAAFIMPYRLTKPPTQRMFACNISLKDAEDILIESLIHQGFDAPRSCSYLTTLYQRVPSAYCLTLILDIAMETVSLGTAFNEVKNRCLENKVIEVATPRGDADTMAHLIHLYKATTEDPYVYGDVLQSLDLTGYSKKHQMM